MKTRVDNFLKPDSSLIINNDPFTAEFSSEIHYEVKILVKIKKVGKSIPITSHISIMTELVWELI